MILDDASSEIYYAQLVEEESTATVMAAVREVIERRGCFARLYSDRGSHFWLTPKAGGKVDPHRLTQVGRALRELGVQMIPAYSPQARGRSERNFGTWQGRLPQELRLAGIDTVEAANQFLREHYVAEFNRRFQVPPAQRGSAFAACRHKDLDLVFALQFERTVNRDNTVSFQNLNLQIQRVKLERNPGRLQCHCAPAPGWNSEYYPRAAPIGTFHRPGHPRPANANRGARSRGKDGGCAALENASRFPLSPSFGGCGRLTSNRTFHLLRKPDILTCYEQRGPKFVSLAHDMSG